MTQAAPGIRHRIVVAVFVEILLLASAAATVRWFEADKEVRVLCGLMDAGTSRAEVARILGTANLLAVRPAGTDPATAPALTFDAAANLRTTRCEVTLGDDGVVASRFFRALRLERVAVAVALLLLLGLIGLQVGLATGRISGRLAWGGRFETLPARYRRSSAITAVALLIVGWLWLERTGVTHLVGSTPVVETAAWVIAVLWLLSTQANLASSSRPERRLGIPLGTALTILAVVIAYAG